MYIISDTIIIALQVLNHADNCEFNKDKSPPITKHPFSGWQMAFANPRNTNVLKKKVKFLKIAWLCNIQDKSTDGAGPCKITEKYPTQLLKVPKLELATCCHPE